MATDRWSDFAVAGAASLVQTATWGARASISTFAAAVDGEFCERQSTGSSMCTPSDTAAVAAGVACGLGPVFGVVAGHLSGKFGARVVSMTSAVLCASALLLSSGASTSAGFIIAYAPLMGIGSGFMVTPGAFAVGTRFSKFLGLAMGILYGGGGLGSALVPRLAGLLLTDLGEDRWREVMRWLAVLMAAAFLLSAFVTERQPAPHRGDPDERTPDKPLLPPSQKQEPLSRTLFSARYAVYLAAAICYGYAYYASLFFIVPFSRAHGHAGTPYGAEPVITLDQATTMMLAFGLSQCGGSWVLGAVASHLNKPLLYFLCCLASAATMIAFPYCRTVLTIGVASSCLGVLTGGSRLCFPSMVAEAFPGPHLGSMMGLTLMGFGLGALPAPPVSASIIASRGGDYRLAMFLMAAAFGCSGLIAFVGHRLFHTAASTDEETSINVAVEA